MKNESLVIVLIGPSGVGKSSLRDFYCNKSKNVKKLLAVTNRQARPYEINGIDKHFVSDEDFILKETSGELSAINNVYKNKYAFYSRDLKSGDIFISELYYKNYESFRLCHYRTISVYIKPYKFEAIEKNIIAREASDAEKSCRLMEIDKEYNDLEDLAVAGYFDYIFINEYDYKSKLLFEKLIDDIIAKEVNKE